jgi:hypothetical protein
LSPDQLRRRTDSEQLNFASTADLPELPIFVGQERPISAIRFGVKMNRPGYNIFALGPAGLGKYTLVHSAVQERAAAEPPPADWCYVNNFSQPYSPKVLRLPNGMGRQFRNDMERLEARRFGKAVAPRKTLAGTDTSGGGRHVPAAVRRAVRERDGERCRFVDEQGRRCSERHRLEFHHRLPFGMGGDHSLVNISLLCAQHNRSFAERDYGRSAIRCHFSRERSVAS